jgi:hypothetical protein
MNIVLTGFMKATNLSASQHKREYGKMATATVIKTLPSGTECIVGYVCQYPSGEYWFNPRMAGRKSSRKAWAKADQCIPRWAKGEGVRVDYHSTNESAA